MAKWYERLNPLSDTRTVWGDVTRAVGAAPLLGITSSEDIAANRQKEASQGAQATQEQAYGGVINRYQPLTEQVRPGFEKFLAGILGGQFDAPNNVDVTQDPGYQFRLNEGINALERRASAGGVPGGRGGTGYGKFLTQYAQDYASNEWGRAMDRETMARQNRMKMLSSLADMYTGNLGTLSNMELGRAGITAGGISERGNIESAAEMAKSNQFRSFLQDVLRMGGNNSQQSGQGGNSGFDYSKIGQMFSSMFGGGG